MGDIAYPQSIQLALYRRAALHYDEAMAAILEIRAKRNWWIAAAVLLLLAAAVLLLRMRSAAQAAANARAWAAFEVIYNQPLKQIQAAESDSPDLAPADAQPVTATGAGRPQVALSSNFYDFGMVATRAVVSRDFLLVNRGSAPLLIRRAYTTCGCTSAALTATIIPPGKASRATITFNAGYHPVSGQTVRRGLILETNDPDRPEVEIWVQAAVGR